MPSWQVASRKSREKVAVDGRQIAADNVATVISDGSLLGAVESSVGKLN